MSSSNFLHRSFGLLRRLTHVLVLAVLSLAAWSSAFAADAAAGSDVIVLSNGDQITGKLLHVVKGTVTFHSDVLGDLNVPWDKIKSIRTSQKFAVIPEGVTVSRKTADHNVPQGTVAVENQEVQVTAAPSATPITVPVAKAQYMIDEDTYFKEIRAHPSFLHGWTGQATAGAAQIQATQNSTSFTSAASAVRPVPSVSWLSPSSRTDLNFNAAYGSVTQPGLPTVKTNIVHGDVQQDWFLTPRLFALVSAAFDHNYSQGLDLQQIYGGGLGYTLIKTSKEELDLKGSLNFERQTFGFTPGIFPPVVTPSRNLIGASVGDTYMLKLPYGMVFDQGLRLNPAFNQTNAFSFFFNAGLTLPVYKRFAFNLSVLDNYLNNPAVGSKNNTFQYAAGVTYTF